MNFQLVGFSFFLSRFASAFVVVDYSIIIHLYSSSNHQHFVSISENKQ